MSTDGIPELLSEHARVMDEKQRAFKSGQTPPTSLNYQLTNLVNQIVELAKSQRSEEVRSLLAREAEAGHFGADSALEWLAEEDSWWSERSA